MCVGGVRCLFSVEKAICPSVSSGRLVPTGRKRDGYLKMGRMEDKIKRGVLSDAGGDDVRRQEKGNK